MPLAIHLLLATAMAASATRGLLAQAAQVAPASPRASRTPQVGAKKAGAEAAAAAPHEVTAADLGDPSGTEAAAATDGLSNIAPSEPQPDEPSSGANMVPLATPTSDFSATPDDLWFCRDRHYCHHNGGCDRAAGACLCDHPWQGDECAQGVLQAEKSGNTILVSQLDAARVPRDDRADGNELFLAKAHHRLRQVVAELSLMGEPDEALVREKYKLMKSLGLQYTHPGVRAHELTINQDPARVAARHPSNRRLPAVVTMRWTTPVPDDSAIIHSVQDSLDKAFRDVLAPTKVPAVEGGAGGVAVADTTRLGVFSQGKDVRRDGAMVSPAAEPPSTAGTRVPKGTILSFESGATKDAPVRNIEHEGPWDLDPEQPFALNVADEHTDMVPGIKLVYPGASGTDTVAVNPGDDPEAISKQVSAMSKLKTEHEKKESALTKALTLEASAEGLSESSK